MSTPQMLGPEIFERAVALKFEAKIPGNDRNVSTTKITVDADKSRVKAGKRKINSKELEAIVSHAGATRLWLREVIALPSPLGDGSYLTPIELVQKADARLVERKDEWDTVLLPTMRAAYPQRVEEASRSAAEGGLGGLFDPRDYDPVDVYMAKFQMYWSYETWGTPGVLERIDKTIFNREQGKATDKLWETVGKVEEALFSQLKELADHMVNRLTPEADGSPKIFKGPFVERFQEFLSLLKARNITGNVDLAALGEQAEKILAGIDTKELRNSDRLREYVREQLAKVKVSIDQAVTARPTRMFRGEEEAA